MLKNINQLLSPELLAHLQAMGHGDSVAIVTRNFPAAAKAARLVVMPGVRATDVAEAILSVLPIDTAVEPAVFRIEAAGAPEMLMPVHEEFQAIADAAEGRRVAVDHLDRYDFYRRTEDAYVVVATGEDRLYGCFLITKGIIL